MREMPALSSPMGRVMVRTTNMLIRSAEAATKQHPQEHLTAQGA